MDELGQEILEKIELMLREGDELTAQTKYRDALGKYMLAYAELPDPKEDWKKSAKVFNALGYCHINLHEYGAADYFYNQVLFCPEGLDTAESWLGMGIAKYELGDMHGAKDALLSAYMLEGAAIFDEHDTKYFDFLKTDIGL